MCALCVRCVYAVHSLHDALLYKEKRTTNTLHNMSTSHRCSSSAIIFIRFFNIYKNRDVIDLGIIGLEPMAIRLKVRCSTDWAICPVKNVGILLKQISKYNGKRVYGLDSCIARHQHDLLTRFKTLFILWPFLHCKERHPSHRVRSLCPSIGYTYIGAGVVRHLM